MDRKPKISRQHNSIDFWASELFTVFIDWSYSKPCAVNNEIFGLAKIFNTRHSSWLRVSFIWALEGHWKHTSLQFTLMKMKGTQLKVCYNVMCFHSLGDNMFGTQAKGNFATVRQHKRLGPRWSTLFPISDKWSVASGIKIWVKPHMDGNLLKKLREQLKVVKADFYVNF